MGTALPSAIRSSPISTLVIGLGNPLRGDDGVGVHVIQTLANHPLPDGVEVVDGGTQGLGLVTLLEGCDRVIFVDAANMGQPAGQLARFTLDDAHLLGNDSSLSIHEAGLRDVLLLARALNILPNEVIVYGIQPANLDWDSELSAQVRAVVPGLVEALLAEVKHQPPANGS